MSSNVAHDHLIDRGHAALEEKAGAWALAFGKPWRANDAGANLYHSDGDRPIARMRQLADRGVDEQLRFSIEHE